MRAPTKQARSPVPFGLAPLAALALLMTSCGNPAITEPPGGSDRVARVYPGPASPLPVDDESLAADAAATAAAAAASAAEPTPTPAIYREAVGRVYVRTRPDRGAPWRGQLIDCSVVEIVGWDGGPGCDGDWGELADGGWVCSDVMKLTEARPAKAHALIRFDNPTPEELNEYRKTGVWDRDRGPAAEALMPFVYGRAAGRFQGRCYADIKEATSGAAPSGALRRDRRYHFERVIDTDEGSFLELADGRVVPLDDVFLYAPSRFGGVDLQQDPMRDGASPAWVKHGGGNLRLRPAREGALIRELPARTLVAVVADEGAPKGWFRVELSDAEGDGGWMAASRLRRWRQLPRPAGVGDQERWLDVDVGTQTLGLMEGDRLLYATMVSTGVPPDDATPLGVFRIKDKMIHWDMASSAGSDDPYHIEEVPWVMHFWPRFALHAAFWHDGFGTVRSHGCINLAPHDARFLFENTLPRVPPGWHSAWATKDAPGSVLRIRSDSVDVPLRR